MKGSKLDAGVPGRKPAAGGRQRESCEQALEVVRLRNGITWRVPARSPSPGRDIIPTAFRCTPPAEDAQPSEWTREQRAYCGVIGGLGYLGAVLSVTYRVLSVG
jgi:hypothetical protein